MWYLLMECVLESNKNGVRMFCVPSTGTFEKAELRAHRAKVKTLQQPGKRRQGKVEVTDKEILKELKPMLGAWQKLQKANGARELKDKLLKEKDKDGIATSYLKQVSAFYVLEELPEAAR